MTSKTFSRSMIALVTVLVVLLLIRLAMPYGAQWYINKTLNQSEEYSGQVGDVDIMLWRGAYSLENLRIEKANGEVDEPLFAAKEIEFSLLWSALFDGALVGSVFVTKGEINFVDGASEETTQSGQNENWLTLGNQLFPLKIDKLQIRDSRIAFHNPDTQPEIHIDVHDIKLDAFNLVNSRDLSRDLVAKLEASGETAESGTLSVKSSLDPSTEKPTFDLNVTAQNVALVNFKTALDTYAPFDLEAGSLELALELASDNGQVSGYVKPILHEVTVFSWKGDIEKDDDGFFRGLVEAASALVAELFENQSKDQIATRIPIEGSLDNPDTGMWPAIGGVLKNAFIKAMEGKLEGSIQLNDATSQEDNGEKPAGATNEENDDTSNKADRQTASEGNGS